MRFTIAGVTTHESRRTHLTHVLLTYLMTVIIMINGTEKLVICK